jgi:hypothetical protein
VSEQASGKPTGEPATSAGVASEPGKRKAWLRPRVFRIGAVGAVTAQAATGKNTFYSPYERFTYVSGYGVRYYGPS